VARAKHALVLSNILNYSSHFTKDRLKTRRKIKVAFIKKYIFYFSRHDERQNERRNSISSNVSEKTDSLSSEGGNSSRGDLEHLVER